MRRQRLRSAVACALVAVACGTVQASGNDGNKGNQRLLKVEKTIEITMRERANPLDPIVAVVGVLTLRVQPSDGRFVGSITPGYRVPYGSPAGTLGTPGYSVVFQLVNGEFIGDPSVRELQVDGQFTGRGVNMVVRDALGPGEHVFAQGTTERYTGEVFAQDPGRIAGPATGLIGGDRGDWVVVNETNCAHVVSLQPIRDDGSGGDVTLATECVSFRSRILHPVP